MPELHDYASLSTGRATWLKDTMKRWTSRQPVARSFLNEFVRDRMGFNDVVPSLLRDMGVPSSFYERAEPAEPEFDMVYVGSVTKSRGVDRLAQWAIQRRHSLLLVGTPELAIEKELSGEPGVTLYGPAKRSEIPDLTRKARFAFNITPAIHPLDRQTSTKVLEYLALGMPVITNDYYWIRRFEEESGARMYRFVDFGSLRLEDVASFPYVIPDMSPYRWDAVWERSGIVDVLASVA
ncbi:glycosyltransferase [Microlunatus sp. Y2014]|uniref:glycosyltransferase n=1 Tax=Microlunatus sp. Y2014 TaxID=3418488 RepID=UPI003DA77993